MANLDQATLVLLVSVSLLQPHTVTAQENCSLNGDLRLQSPVEHDRTIEGAVEFCLEGFWRVVCGSAQEWRELGNRVACEQLGYGGGGVSTMCQSTNHTQFVTVDCSHSGSVNSLQECEVMIQGYCFECLPVVSCVKACCENSTRLEGGSTDSEGRVEVCVDGHWGTVQTRQPRQVAEAVCGTQKLQSHNISLGDQFGYRLSKLVYQCDVSDGGGLTCSEGDTDNHSMDLGVVCGPPPQNTQCSLNGQFRLADGSTISEGRVEVCVDGRWGTVCNNSQEGIAGVVCSQLRWQDGETVAVPHILQLGVSDLTRKTYDCYSSTTCTETCCDHSTSLAVRCYTLDGPQIGTAVPVVLVLLLTAVTVIVVIIVAIVVRRRRSTNFKQRNTDHPLRQLDNQVHSEAIPTERAYNFLEPANEISAPENGRLSTCIIINPLYDKTPAQVQPVDPTPVRDESSEDDDFFETDEQAYSVVVDGRTKPKKSKPVRGEASRREDDFYDAEKHTYSFVDKKRAKKTPEYGEGEREEPPDYEPTVFK